MIFYTEMVMTMFLSLRIFVLSRGIFSMLLTPSFYNQPFTDGLSRVETGAPIASGPEIAGRGPTKND